MFLARIRLLNQNSPFWVHNSHLFMKPNLQLGRFCPRRPNYCVTRKQVELLCEKGYDINLLKGIKQPYRALFIFFVGKAQCPAAIESCKEMILCLARILSRQWKVHTCQRLHRGLQLYSCYSRMFGEEVTRKMLAVIRRFLISSGKGFLVSAVCLTPFEWDKNLITDDKLDNCVKEFETVGELCSCTLYCQDCHKRQIIDQRIAEVDYCMCKGSLGYADHTHQFDGWEAFLERENILVWRKQHQSFSHLYSYKVFGTYDDLSVNAFMEVQLNTSYRTEWDSTALQLEIVDSHTRTDSDLLYWLVKFPHFFANRDYVFQRRLRVNEKKKEVVIVNEIATHDGLPEVNGIHRVKEYWSIMVLRAKEEFNKPGMSYTLTYFDNPGTSLPAPVTNFVASTGFPDFLSKVHRAALNLQVRWENGEDVYVSLPPHLRRLKTIDKIPEIFPNIEEEPGDDRKEISVCENVTDIDDGQLKDRISLRYKAALIELLEAIEVLAPSLEEKTLLTSKIEALVDKLSLEQSKKSKLVKRLESIRQRTRTFIHDSAKKKEESIKIMKEFEKKRNYYEHSQSDDPTLLQFTGLLQSINEIMMEDKDMRTGRLLFNNKDSLGSSGNVNNVDVSVSNNIPITVQEKSVIEDSSHDKAVKNSDTVTSTRYCECCACDSNKPNEIAWYNFIYLTSWWRTSDEEENKPNFCDNCSCKHKPKRRVLPDKDSDLNDKDVKKASKITSAYNNTNEFSWFSNMYSLFAWSKSTNTNNTSSNDSLTNPQNNSNSDHNVIASSTNSSFDTNTLRDSKSQTSTSGTPEATSQNISVNENYQASISNNYYSKSTTNVPSRSASTVSVSCTPWYWKLWHFIF